MSSKLINYSGISENLTGNKDKIRSNQVPKKYKGVVQDCHDAVEKVLESFKKGK